MTISGVYAIKCNGRAYVGRATNLAARWTNHLSALVKGQHHNKALQSDFDTYGLPECTFCVLEACTVEELEEREYVHIRRLKQGTDYNISILKSAPLPEANLREIKPSDKITPQLMRDLRHQIGLTQIDLGRITGEFQSTISSRERGKVPITRTTFFALLYLKTLSRAELDALLADPSKLDGVNPNA